MKRVFCLMAFLVSSSAFAEENKAFAEMKAESLANLNQRIELLQQHKGCIQSAQNATEMKKCREERKAGSSRLSDEHKSRRKGRMDARIKKLQEERQKLDDKQ